jgi:hypothetical protein
MGLPEAHNGRMRSIRVLPILLLLLLAAFGPAQYYATKSGKKYHTSRLCSALKSSKEILSVTMTDIQKRHLTQCSKCKSGVGLTLGHSTSTGLKPLKGLSRPKTNGTPYIWGKVPTYHPKKKIKHWA